MDERVSSGPAESFFLHVENEKGCLRRTVWSLFRWILRECC